MSEMIPLAARLDLVRQLTASHLKLLSAYEDLIRPVSQALGSNTADPHADAALNSSTLGGKLHNWMDFHPDLSPGASEEVETTTSAAKIEPIAEQPATQAEPASEQPASQTQTEEPKKRRGRPRKEEQTTQAPESTHTPDPTSEPEAEQVFGEADLPITHSQQEVITAVEDAADEIAASTPPAEEGDPDAAPVTEIRAGLTRYLQLTDKKRMQTLRDALMEQHSFTSFSDLETRHSTRETILAQVKAAVEQAEGDDWSELLS